MPTIRAVAAMAVLLSALAAGADEAIEQSGYPDKTWVRSQVDEVGSVASAARNTSLDALGKAEKARADAGAAERTAGEAHRAASSAVDHAAHADRAANQATERSKHAEVTAGDAKTSADASNQAVTNFAGLAGDLEKKRVAELTGWMAAFRGIADAQISAWRALEEKLEKNPNGGAGAGATSKDSPAVHVVQQQDASTAKDTGELANASMELGTAKGELAACEQNIDICEADRVAALDSATLLGERARDLTRTRKERDESRERAIGATALAKKWNARKDALEKDKLQIIRKVEDAELRREYIATMVGAAASGVKAFWYAALVPLAFAMLALTFWGAGRWQATRLAEPGPLPPEREIQPPFTRRVTQLVLTAAPPIIMGAAGVVVLYVMWRLNHAWDDMHVQYEGAKDAWSATHPGLKPFLSPQVLSPQEVLKELLTSQAWKSALGVLPFAGIAGGLRKLQSKAASVKPNKPAQAGADRPVARGEGRAEDAPAACATGANGCKSLQELRTTLENLPRA